MSELKAIHAYQLTTNTEDSDVYIHNDEFGCGGDLVECYLKSEADKVIAEKDAEIARLKALAKEPFLSNRVCRKCGKEGTLMYMPAVEDNHTFWDLYNNKGIDYVFSIRCAHCGEVAFVTKQAHDYELKTKELKTKAVERYKRCLAMAQQLFNERTYWHYRYDDWVDRGYDRKYKWGKVKWCGKWGRKWLAIAEKFKEAK